MNGSLSAAEYRGEHSRSQYNFYGYIAIVVGLVFVGTGCVQLFSKTEHPEYFASPTCDESLLLDGQMHLGQPCSVLLGKIHYHNVSTSKFDFKVDTDDPRIRAFDKGLPMFPETSFAWWTDSDPDQPVAVQVFKAGGDYIVAKVYDAVDKKVRYPNTVPRSRLGNAWFYAKIGLITLGIAAIWFLVAPWMMFSSERKGRSRSHAK